MCATTTAAFFVSLLIVLLQLLGWLLLLLLLLSVKAHKFSCRVIRSRLYFVLFPGLHWCRGGDKGTRRVPEEEQKVKRKPIPSFYSLESAITVEP